MNIFILLSRLEQQFTTEEDFTSIRIELRSRLESGLLDRGLYNITLGEIDRLYQKYTAESIRH